jgi:hypothetical protein
MLVTRLNRSIIQELILIDLFVICLTYQSKLIILSILRSWSYPVKLVIDTVPKKKSKFIGHLLRAGLSGDAIWNPGMKLSAWRRIEKCQRQTRRIINNNQSHLEHSKLDCNCLTVRY